MIDILIGAAAVLLYALAAAIILPIFASIILLIPLAIDFYKSFKDD